MVNFTKLFANIGQSLLSRQRNGEGGDRKEVYVKLYPETVQPSRDVYEAAIAEYNKLLERNSASGKSLVEQKLTYMNGNEIETFSKWTEGQIAMVNKGVESEVKYQAFKEAQKKDNPQLSIAQDMDKSNETKVRHIQGFDDAIKKLQPLHVEINSRVREFSRDMNDKKRSHGDYSKEFKDAKAKYETAKHFRNAVGLNQAMIENERDKAIFGMTGNKIDKEKMLFSEGKIQSSKLKFQESYRIMESANKVAAQGRVNSMLPPPPVDNLAKPPMPITPRPAPQYSNLPVAPTGYGQIPSDQTLRPQRYDSVPQNQYQNLPSPRELAVMEAKSELEKAARQEKAARSRAAQLKASYEKNRTPEGLKAVNVAIIAQNEAIVKQTEAKLNVKEKELSLLISEKKDIGEHIQKMREILNKKENREQKLETSKNQFSQKYGEKPKSSPIR